MLRFEFNTYDYEDFEFDHQEIKLEWQHEEENIYEILERFKYFLLAKSYSPELVERIQYLEDSQFAKFKLSE